MMKMEFVLFLIMLAFASDEITISASDEIKIEIEENYEKQVKIKNIDDLILVKLEESEYLKDPKKTSILVKRDEHTKRPKKTSQLFGVSYQYSREKSWQAARWSTKEKKMVHNGSYRDEEAAGHASDTLARKLIANGELNHKLNFPNDDSILFPENKRTSVYIGVSYNKRDGTWRAQRRSKSDNKMVYQGIYKDEETAAHGSDTLARKLMENGEQNHELNFPDDIIEVSRPKERCPTSKFIGVSYCNREKRRHAWSAQRWCKNERRMVYNGLHKDEMTAAFASDTLARHLIANGEENHKLNFPDEDDEVYKKIPTSNYIGVHKKRAKWAVHRWSKNQNRMVYNGCYKSEEKAALASDTLARNLIANGEKNHRLNFLDNDIEVYPEEKVNSTGYVGACRNGESEGKWCAQRRSKIENNMVYNECYKDDVYTAHASDTLAKELIENGEKNHRLNFTDDSEVRQQRIKRKRHKELGFWDILTTNNVSTLESIEKFSNIRKKAISKKEFN